MGILYLIILEPLPGLEPGTYSLQVSCSTTELKRLVGRSLQAQENTDNVVVRKAEVGHTEVSRSFDDRPGFAFGLRRGRNVRAPFDSALSLAQGEPGTPSG